MYQVTKLHYHKQSRQLDIYFDDDYQVSLSCEYLRVHSPSAEVQGHGQPRLVTGKAEVAIVDLEAVGHYAVRLCFDDGHQSGLYSWQYLRTLAIEYPQRWQAYQDACDQVSHIPIRFSP